MQPISRPRILVVSSDPALRERIVAVMASRFDVMSWAGWGTAAYFEDVALAVVSEPGPVITGVTPAAWPVIVARESFDAEELLERELHAHEIDQASPLLEADQQIEVAVRPRVVAGARAEDTDVVGAVSARDAEDRFGRKMGHGNRAILPLARRRIERRRGVTLPSEPRSGPKQAQRRRPQRESNPNPGVRSGWGFRRPPAFSNAWSEQR